MEGTLRFSSNMKHRAAWILLLMVLFVFPGCASLISGYNSKFQCPNTNKGKCVSVKTAYRESIEGGQENPLVKEGRKEEQCKECKEGKGSGNAEEGQPARDNSQPEDVYRAALYRKLTSMIGKPSTPLVVPPEVVRVLILSYTGSNNELFSYRYVYFFATEPKWIISTAREVN